MLGGVTLPFTRFTLSPSLRRVDLWERFGELPLGWIMFVTLA